MMTLAWSEFVGATKQQLEQNGFVVEDAISGRLPIDLEVGYLVYPGGFVAGLPRKRQGSAPSGQESAPFLTPRTAGQLPYTVEVSESSTLARAINTTTTVQKVDAIDPFVGRVTIEPQEGTFSLHARQTLGVSGVHVAVSLEERALARVLDQDEGPAAIRVTIPVTQPGGQEALEAIVDVVAKGNQARFNQMTVAGIGAKAILSAANVTPEELDPQVNPDAPSLLPKGMAKLLPYLSQLLGINLDRPLDRRATAQAIYQNMRNRDFSLLGSLVFSDTSS